jgi:hypothetical protein
MKHEKHDGVYVIRLEAGEDIVPTLNAFCAGQNITAGSLSAIGAVGEATLGYMSMRKKEYVKRDFRGELEVVSITGNVSVMDGKPFVHAHATLSGYDETGILRDFQAVGGHLFRGIVSLMVEITLTPINAAIERKKLPDMPAGMMQLSRDFRAESNKGV